MLVIVAGTPYSTSYSSSATPVRVYSTAPLMYTVTVVPLLTKATCDQADGRSAKPVLSQIPRVPVPVESSWYISEPKR